MRNVLYPCAVVLLLALTYPRGILAQPPQERFNLVTGTNGIQLGKINNVIQDKYGYIWLSDQNNGCILRFDGSQMIRYKYDAGNPNSLGGNYPECLATDSTGVIWIGFFGMGLDRFDPATGTFTHYRHNPDDSASLCHDFVSAVTIDRRGNIWVGSYGGLDLLDQKTGKFTHYKHADDDSTSLSYNVVRAIYEDKAGALWIGTGFPWENNTLGGLNLFHRGTGTFTQYLHDPNNPNSLIHNKVRAIFEDSRGTFWIGTQGDGLHTMDRKTGVFTRLLYNPEKPDQISRPPVASREDHITFITEDAEKKIWIGTLQNGIIRYDPVSKHITHFGNEFDSTKTLKDYSGWSAYTSSDGLIWLTTQETNLYTVDVQPNLVSLVEINGARGFSDMYEERDGVLLFGTERGLLWKDLAKKTATLYKIDPKNPISMRNRVRQLHKDFSGNFWIGTMDGLFLFDAKSKTFTPFLHDSNVSTTINSNDVISFFQDDDSTLWVGTFDRGLDRLHIRSGKFEHHTNHPPDTTGISSNLVSTIAKDITGDLWLGTGNQGGMNRLNNETKTFKHYLYGRDIYAFYEDDSGVIWVGTNGGLFRYDRKSDNFVLVTEKMIGFEIPSVISIVEDNQHNLWLANSNGIIKLNEQRDHVVPLTSIPRSENFYYGSAIRRRNGELLFGAFGGYYTFHPEKLKMEARQNPLHVSGFWLGTEEVKPGANGPLRESILDAKEIKLDHDQNIFSFTFTLIDFRNTGEIKIYYKLENYDNDWHSASQNSKIQYFKIPPGDYILHIRDASSAGKWAEKRISITLSPPWWSTEPAYAGYALLLLSAVYVLYRVQKNRVIQAERERTRARELEQKKEIEKAYAELKATQSQLIQSEKMASLGELTAGIAHEIQNPLNFVNNFSEINTELISEMKEELSKGNLEGAVTLATDIDENEKKIVYHGKRADAIVKGMLQHSRSNSGQKESTEINALADEYLRLTYHGLRAKDKSFNANFETDLDPAVGKINVSPQEIGRVFLNLLNNAFYAVNQKKSQVTGTPEAPFEPTVTVKTTKLTNSVEIKIIDNGNGIPARVLDKIFQPFFTTKPTGQGTGLGLSISYDIITKGHGGELKVQTSDGKGTTFTIILPG